MFENDYSSLRAQEFDSTQIKKDPYQKFYRAYVIKNDDPDGRGQIKVRIPAFHGLSKADSLYFTDDQLPWAEPGLCICASNNSGSLMVPEMGSTVWVTFEYGTNNIIYFGGIYFNAPENSRAIRFPRDTFYGEVREIINSDRISEFNSSSDKIIYKSPKGSIIMISDKDHSEQIKIIDPAGQKIILNSSLTDDQINGVAEVSDRSYMLLQRTEEEFIQISKDTIDIKAKHVKINGKEV